MDRMLTLGMQSVQRKPPVPMHRSIAMVTLFLLVLLAGAGVAGAQAVAAMN